MRIKYIVILTATCILSSLSGIALPVQTTPSTESHLDFTHAAKIATPAVVSIKIEKVKAQSIKVKAKTNPWDDDDDNYEFSNSNEQFWHHFFKSPQESDSDIIMGQASGFLVSPDGYIITNNHVVENAGKIVVNLNDGSEYIGKLVGLDSNTDIALIKIEEKNLPFLKLGNSDSIEVGQWILAIGTPLGLQATVTAGIVSAKGRNNLDLARIEDFIQTDTAINRGNSGGPLLNLNGEVVGVNTAIVGNLDGNSGGNMGIGFAVPSNIAKNVMDQLIAKGSVSRSFIGVDLQPIDHDLASVFGLHKPEGALVSQVVKDSPAAKAGIKQGDIITKLNEATVNSIGGFRTSIALMTPGSKLKLSLMRDGKPMEIALETSEYLLAKKPKEQSTEDLKLGILVTDLTPELAQRLNFIGEKGVIITGIEPGSAAHLAGLTKGTLIMAINQKSIDSLQEYEKEIANVDKSKPILFLIKDGSKVRFISLRIRS